MLKSALTQLCYSCQIHLWQAQSLITRKSKIFTDNQRFLIIIQDLRDIGHLYFQCQLSNNLNILDLGFSHTHIKRISPTIQDFQLKVKVSLENLIIHQKSWIFDLLDIEPAIALLP